MAKADSERSARLLVRGIGVLALAGIVTGAFDIGYVQSKLMVAGDASATLHNLFAHQTLFRMGFSAHVFELLLNVIGEILGFVLLRRVNGIVAAIALCCGFVGISIEAVDLLIAYLPLKIAIGGSALSAFSSEQVQGLLSLAVQWQQAGLLLSWVFYGVDEFASGLLFFRSGFMPRVLGLLLAVSGLCYFTHGFLSFLAPSLDARLYPYILFPCLPGEALGSLWMATVGLNVTKWREWAVKSSSPGSISIG